MRFKKIYIEITNTCNLNCSFCVQNSRENAMMTPEQFEHILKQIHRYTKTVYLHVLGEPLMHPQLDVFLGLANQYHLQVNITTNATLLPKQLPILLKHNHLHQINISLHAFPDKPNYLNETLDCAEQLSAQGKYVSLRLWTIENNQLNNEMKELMEKLVARYHVEVKHLKDSIKLLPSLFLSFDSLFTWPSIHHSFVSNRGNCQGWRHMCGILVDGRVVVCCLDSKAEAKLGNIYEESFDLILDRNEKLVEDFRKHKLALELCQHCSYHQRFNQ